MKVLVTGGAGFIGSAVVRLLAGEVGAQVVNLDALTYAGNLDSLAPIGNRPNYRFVRGNVCDGKLLAELFAAEQPDVVMHLAAESHVDRSIDGPGDFITTNVVGTYCLLEAARTYWSGLPGARKEAFRFHHISTDEVYGSLGPDEMFTETTRYAPNSPYSASKASSDHLVRAWHHTYGLPTIVTNCSNNYGPYHFPEKLIPLMILNGLEGKPLPVYGKGENVRDWLYVEDHARALWLAVTRGHVGEVYNIGGEAERANIDVVHTICDLLDELAPGPQKRRELIAFVADRPGHDLRYAMDIAKISRELGWRPIETFESGLRKTVRWYLDNRDWWTKIRSGRYAGQRLGLAEKKERMSDILLTGANGQLGWEIARRAPAHGVSARGFTHAELDIADDAAVTRAVAAGAPKVVVNAAAYTAVDKAEGDAATAYAVNRDGAGNLARACARAGVPLIHISTDYVFDGGKAGPYLEDDPVAPLGVYGASKLAGEEAVRASGARHIILRTAWVYGVHGQNFVKTMLRLAQDRDVLRVVDDQRGCPTFAADLAAAVLMLARRLIAGTVPADGLGTFNCVGGGETTWCAFARRIFAEAGPRLARVPRVDAIPTAEYPTPARRPANSVLDCGKLARIHGISLRPWPEALAEMLAALTPAK